jgi:hypothetical protein
LTQIIRDRKTRKIPGETLVGELEKLRRRFQEIRETDYFQNT